MPEKLNLLYSKFGRLSVIDCADSIDGRSAWVCACKCGTKIVALGKSLTSGNTRSCGCLQLEARRDPELKSRKHGRGGNKSRCPTYMSWWTMRGRCDNPNNKDYHNYGGRGIQVCKRWHKFENFLTDMGDRPAGLTLDRINNDLGYSKPNCRWSTRKEQSRNRRCLRG